MAKTKTKTLHPHIVATFTSGEAAEKTVAAMVKKCDALKAAAKLTAADRDYLGQIVEHVPPVRPHASEALAAHEA